jgi:hypothetical protein
MLAGATAVALMAAGVACTSGPPSGAPPGVWTTDSLTRVALEDPPSPAHAAAVSAARNEYESFQIVVSGGGSPLTVEDVTVTELEGPDGATIPAGDITLYREHYVEVERGSPDRGGSNRPDGPGRYADALVPFVDPDTRAELSGSIRARGAVVQPGQNQPYWIDVRVPKGAPAGEYTGTYEVTTDQGSFDGPVTLTVLDFTLPDAPLLRTAFLSESDSEPTSRELLRHGLMPGSSLPLLGRLGGEAGLNAVNAGFYSGADRDNCELEPPPTPAEIRERTATASPGALVYNYTADEIDECDGFVEPLLEWARNLHAAGVMQLVTMPPDPRLFSDGIGRPGVDIWAVLPKDFDTEVIDQMRRADARMQLWSYTALAQDNYSPKWLIDYSPANFRILPGFLNYSQGITGTLYWRVDNWEGVDPWETVVLYDDRFPADGMFVYPGEEVGLPGGVVPSIRLKWVRDGVDDYTYARLAARVNAVDAERIVRSVGQDWRTWSDDPEELYRARLELAGLLDPAARRPPR